MNTSGIYTITNSVNGKLYVGSSTNLKKRWQRHRDDLRKGIHKNTKLQNSWNKYGASLFQFKSLLLCAPAHLFMFEQRAIDVLKPDYNIKLSVDPAIGISVSVETRAKMRKAKLGRKLPPEHCARIAAAHLGKPKPWAHKGHPMSLEARQKLSLMHIGMNHTPESILKMRIKQIAWRLRKKLAIRPSEGGF